MGLLKSTLKLLVALFVIAAVAYGISRYRQDSLGPSTVDPAGSDAESELTID